MKCPDCEYNKTCNAALKIYHKLTGNCRQGRKLTVRGAPKKQEATAQTPLP